MDQLVNRTRAKSSAANVAVPTVLARSSTRSSGPSVQNEDPFDRFTHARIARLLGGFRRWASPRRRSIGRCTLPRLRGVRRYSRSARCQNRRPWCKRVCHCQARARVAALPNAPRRTTAVSQPRTGDTGRFRSTPKVFLQRSGGGTRRRRNLRRDAPPSRAAQFHHPTSARHCRSVQLPPHESGRAQSDPERGRGQPHERSNAFFGRSSASVAQRAQRGGQRVRAGEDRRLDQGRRRQAHRPR